MEVTRLKFGGFSKVASLGGIDGFLAHAGASGLSFPCDKLIETSPGAPLVQSHDIGGLRLSNRFCVLPMEGWEGSHQDVFGAQADDPTEPDFAIAFCEVMDGVGITLLNVTAGSPYYNPHVSHPALYPPSDGYRPPEEPFAGVLRLLHTTHALKRRFPRFTLVGSGYTYLQDYLPHVAQAAVRQGWTDFVGLGRMVLSYPELPRDVFRTGALQKKRICRTFSDCTTAPRDGIISGCYPLDPLYKRAPKARQLAEVKKAVRLA